MLRSLIWSPFLALFAFVVSCAAAQTPSVNSTNMPRDPKSLILLAAQSNDLLADGVKPWHAKVTFKFMDDQGNVTDEGSYEEFWAGPGKFKRSFSGKGYTQTDFSAASGVMRSGQREDVSRLLIDMRRDLVSPLPNARSLGNGPFSERDIDSGGTHLRCIFLTSPAQTPTYCIANDEPILRLSSWPADGIQILHNRILRFQGLYVPGELAFVRGGKTVLSVHLESIEVLDPVIDSEFAPPTDAVFVPLRINISGGVAVGLIEHKVPPEYPPEAQARGIQGVVVLEAVIGVDGGIKDLRVVSGAPIFQKSALDAVRKWRYRPYLLNGIPVEVRTTVNVIFSLGG